MYIIYIYCRCYQNAINREVKYNEQDYDVIFTLAQNRSSCFLMILSAICSAFLFCPLSIASAEQKERTYFCYSTPEGCTLLSVETGVTGRESKLALAGKLNTSYFSLHRRSQLSLHGVNFPSIAKNTQRLATKPDKSVSFASGGGLNKYKQPRLLGLLAHSPSLPHRTTASAAAQ